MKIVNKLPQIVPVQARQLIERIADIKLYAHAYSFHLNFRFNKMTIEGLLEFAHKNQLSGMKIHLDDGEEFNLRFCDDARLERINQLAKKLNLDIHVEVSSTDLPEMKTAVRIAHALSATSIRCYPRYAGKVSEIISWTTRDLKLLTQLDPDGCFRFTLEQHEDLTGSELVQIIEAVDNPKLKLLFDFSNMINAYELPLAALEAMAPYITDVHIKDVKVIEEDGGWGQLGCRSGEGEIPQALLLLELLLLGDSQPQVVAYGLEEEVDFYASARRFINDVEDPIIAYREASDTPIDKDVDLNTLLATERQNALDQIKHIHVLLDKISQHAQSYRG